MEKFAILRSKIWRNTRIRSARSSSVTEHQLCNGVPRYSTHFHSQPRRSIFSSSVTNRVSLDCWPPIALSLGSIRSFSDDVSHMPVISDPDIKNVFKDLMAASWDELPEPVIHDAKKALTKSTNDKAGQEALTNVFRAAEAVEKFGGILISMKMELDDAVGLSGENVQPLSDDFVNALRVAHQRYVTYLDSFGPEETYLRKKVETELGSKMIYLKMRCSGLGSEWGKSWDFWTIWVIYRAKRPIKLAFVCLDFRKRIRSCHQLEEGSDLVGSAKTPAFSVPFLDGI